MPQLKREKGISLPTKQNFRGKAFEGGREEIQLKTGEGGEI